MGTPFDLVELRAARILPRTEESMREMNRDEWRSFVLSGSRTAKLATVRKDGRPHVVPIWFVLDGDDLVFTTTASTLKARNMRRDPRVSVCIDDEAFPFAFVRIEGTVAFEELSPDRLLPWTTELARRYVGDDRAVSFGRRNAVEGELLARITPSNVIARMGIAD